MSGELGSVKKPTKPAGPQKAGFSVEWGVGNSTNKRVDSLKKRIELYF